MIWVILCIDKPNSFEKRMRIIDEHRSYLATKPIKTLISGPLTDISGKVMNGSFFMVEADTENEVKEFQSNDPIFRAGIWDQITISPFNKRVDNLSKIWSLVNNIYLKNINFSMVLLILLNWCFLADFYDSWMIKNQHIVKINKLISTYINLKLIVWNPITFKFLCIISGRWGIVERLSSL